MRRHLVLAALAAIAVTPVVHADDCCPSWIFRPSQYSHDPKTGERVAQYAQEQPAYVREDLTYEQSAYRQIRTGFRVGDAFDFMHIVETWGRGESIRPYGEWLYPYRAGATPYGPWGNPQGPWTTPFGSWMNPYGLGPMPNPYWMPWGNVPQARPALPANPSPVPPPPAASQIGPHGQGGVQY